MYDFTKLNGMYSLVSSAMKTPYKLDLEVKDRKPDIVPKVGDKVKIKSREWYEKWKGSFGSVDVPCSFTSNMSKRCGKIMTVKSKSRFFYMEEDDNIYTWSLEMFEEVYPQESSKEVECTKAFEAFKISSDALEKSLVASSAIPAINPVQGIGISYDLGTLSRQGAGIETCPIPSPRITFPLNRFGSTSAVARQDLFEKKEPELQTIKKHRFIKLENL